MATKNIDSMKKYLPKTKETVKLKVLLNRSTDLAVCFFGNAVIRVNAVFYCIIVFT